MSEFPPRYQDYLSPPDVESAEPEHRVSPPFEETVVIMKLRGQEVWHAVWQGEHDALGEYDGTREEAIRWARTKPCRCLIFSEEASNWVPLNSDD